MVTERLLLMGCQRCGQVSLVDADNLTTRAVQSPVASVGRFFAQRCAYDPGARSDSTQVMAAYRSWCESQGVQPVSPQAATGALLELFGIQRGRSNGARLLLNMRLLDAD